ncbi:hypothetical protein CYK37_30215 [Mesorhizobium loti]|nr:ArsR family transcriptional regulator [Mesorhizobium loti]PLP55566.1 hypothetical protein CYK37_30215 [Mesorhizobium loti]
MISSEKENNRRRILLELLIETQRLLVRFRDDPEVTLVALAVRLGWLQKKPLDVSALAASIEMPRSTVIRHLKNLEVRNRITTTRLGNRTIPKSTGVDERPVTAFLLAFGASVASTSSQLSKMDT